MNWYAWCIASISILGLAFIDAVLLIFSKYKRKRILTPNRVLILGTWSSASLMFYALYFLKVEGAIDIGEYINAGLVAVQRSVRLFAFNVEYTDIIGMMNGLNPDVRTMYTALGVSLYVIAPLLTASVILSFFKNITSYIRYVLSFWKDTHVFSELNEKSLALAKNIDERNNKKGADPNKKYKFWKKALIVFTDVTIKNDEKNLELLEEAKEIGAVLFTKNFESIKYRNRRFSPRKVNFYLISENEEEKIRHAESIIRDYDIFDKVELRVFSDDIRCELLLAAKEVKYMKVIRVNDIQSLVYHNLDVHGIRLFKNARDVGSSDKVISAVIVGLGKYGLEMMKALTWFCQMPGYRLKINAFDVDEHAKDKFVNMCPELMSDRFNGQHVPGEACYDINIHGGVDINSTAFSAAFSQIQDATYIFVCLGNDDLNLSTAVKIRSLCEQMNFVGNGQKPEIETVIYNSDISEALGFKWESANEQNPIGAKNFDDQYYNIHMIGDLRHLYSVPTLTDSKLEGRGKNVHLRYGEADKFWKYEYNYRSSVAKAMHEKLRSDMHIDIPGIHKAWDERTQEEKLAIGKFEHVRWNAYMRSEGYRFSGFKDKKTKNHMGKLHHNLVPVAELSDDDLRKDA